MAAKKYVQALTQYLAGSGVIIGATNVVLTSLTDIYGNAITNISSFGDKGYITLEPDTTNEEAATFTSVTVNANGTVTLGGVSTTLAQSPYTETSGLVRAHSGGTKVVITDNVAFWNTFGNKNNDETLTGRWGTAVVPSAGNDLVNKTYADGLAIAGAPNSSTTVKGIGEVSVAPVSPTTPIFVGDNDGRVPTQGENDALVGTSGTPSAANPFVTSNDVSASASSNKVARRNASGDLTVSLTPTNANDAGSKQYIDTQVATKLTGLGAWAAANADGSGHQVATDGFLLISADGSTVSQITIKSDSASTPTVVRATSVPTSAGGFTPPLLCPVKKNDYYSITVSGSPANSRYFFIPLS